MREFLMMNKLSTCSVLLALLVSGCANTDLLTQTKTISLQSSPGNFDIVSNPEDFEHIIMLGEMFCLIPSQGVTLTDSGASLDLSEGTDSEKLIGGDLNASSQNLGLTTDLASQVLYRVCELSLSKNLSKSEAIDLYLSSLQAIIEIVNPPKTDAPDIQKSIEN
jgi:hypothetical protein